MWASWIARSLALLVVLMIAAAVVVLVPAKLAGWGAPPPDHSGDAYLLSLVVLPLTWPLYLVVLALVARRARRPRRWAIALSPLLGAWFAILLVFIVDQPSFWAAWLLWLSYGALVPLPPAKRADAG